MTHITMVETRDNFELTHYRFGLFDRKGREFGAQVQTCETTFRDMTKEERAFACSWNTIAAGHYFAVTVQMQKNGISWGSSQPRQYFKTAEERKAYLDKRFADMRKRAATGK